MESGDCELGSDDTGYEREVDEKGINCFIGMLLLLSLVFVVYLHLCEREKIS